MARKKVRVVRLNFHPSQYCGIDRKLKFAVRLMQVFIRESLLSFGLEGKTFSLEGDKYSDCVNCLDGGGGGGGRRVGFGIQSVVRRDGGGADNGGDIIADLEKDFVLTPWEKDLDVDQNPKKIWRDFAQMLVRCGDFNVRRKYLVVGSLAGDGDAFDPVVAQGAGNLAIVIFRNMDHWPENVEGLRRLIGDKDAIANQRRYSHHLGSMLHELCHSFDLHHSASGIMERDFGQIVDVFSYLLDRLDCRCLEPHPETVVSDRQLVSNSFVPPKLSSDSYVPPKISSDSVLPCQLSSDSFVPRHIFGKSTFSAEGLVVLTNHSWLNEGYNDSETPSVEIDRFCVKLVSKASINIKILQIIVDERVAKHMEMEEPTSEFSFRRDHLPSIDLGGRSNLDLLIMDESGNVFKKKIGVYDIYINDVR